MGIAYKIYSKIFPNVDLDNVNDTNKVQVMCPFHEDNLPSAGINPEDGFFHCFVCNGGMSLSIEQFVQKYYKLKNLNAAKALINNFEKELNIDEVVQYQIALQNNPQKYNQLKYLLELDDKTIQELRLCDNDSNYLVNLPIIIDGALLGYKYYNPLPKQFKTTPGITNGLVIPHDLWKNDPRPTLICEGEKDMMIARANGFNAITLIGGCGAKPLMSKYFEGREVIIAYDNDEAGKNGAKELAYYLYQKTNGNIKIKILTNYYEILQHPHDDIFSFFCKDLTGYYKLADKSAYNKSGQDLQQYITFTPYLEETELKQLLNKDIKSIEFSESVNSKYLGVMCNSLVQVRTRYNIIHSIPKTLTVRYKNNRTDNEEYYDFNLDEDLHFAIKYINKSSAIDRNILYQQMKRIIINDLKSQGYKKENFEFGKDWLDNVFEKDNQRIAVYKSTIGQYNQTESNVNRLSNRSTLADQHEGIAYSFTVMEAAKNYKITYKTIDDINKDRSIIYAVYDVECYNDLSNYKPTIDTPRLLDYFKVEDTIENKLDKLYRIRKDNGINHLNYDLWLATELVFNSVLDIPYKQNIIRGALYLGLIGDTRSGKSEVSTSDINLYQQGKFINAKLATINGLVGGYDESSKAIRAGAFSRSNKGLLVLEEIHGEDIRKEYFAKITDVKSSNRIQLSRTVGELTLECKLRLIEISNPVSRHKNIGARSAGDYNGPTLITNLIPAMEDIARNDLYLIVLKSPYVPPNDSPITELNKTAYQEKIKWIWSRTANQVRYENIDYIIQKAQYLQSIFDCTDLPIFGNETDKKLCRMCVALAAMLCSTDDYETIYVKNEHVDFMTSWLEKIYKSHPMRLDEYVANERSYDEVLEGDKEKLELLYSEFSDAIEFLERAGETTKDLLFSISSSKNTNSLLSSLNRYKFTRMKDNVIFVSQKFLKTVKMINRDVVNNQNKTIINNNIKL